jgi:hypothetical protein
VGVKFITYLYSYLSFGCCGIRLAIHGAILILLLYSLNAICVLLTLFLRAPQCVPILSYTLLEACTLRCHQLHIVLPELVCNLLRLQLLSAQRLCLPFQEPKLER